MKKIFSVLLTWTCILGTQLIGSELYYEKKGLPPVLEPHIPTKDDLDHKVKEEKKKQPSTRIEEIVFDEDDPRRDLDLA